jgi:hypothetical protein
MMTPTNNNNNYRQRQQQQQQRLHRRQLLLASCTAIGLALLISSLFLPAALNDSASNNNNNNNATTSSFEAAMSLERWIELQRPSIVSVSVSSHQSRRREDDIRNLAHFAAAAYNNNHSGIQAILPSSIISTTDLTHLSYDSSCLSNEGHRVLGAKYLEGRRSAVASTSVAMMSMMSQEQEMIHSKQDHPRHRWLDHNNAAAAEMSSEGLASVHFPDNNGNSQYLRGGGISVTSTASSGSDDVMENKRHDNGAATAAMMIRKTNMMSPKKLLLRTSAASTSNHHNHHDDETNHHHRNLLINEYEDSTELEGWTTHTGSEIVPPPSTPGTNNEDAQLLQQHIMDYVDGQYQNSGGIPIMNSNAADATTAGSTASFSNNDEEEEEDEDLYQRLQEVMKVTQSLHKQFGGTTTSTSTTNNSNNNMTQYSHTTQHSRQRLLTGSYATWQWYDRSNLASPLNLKLNKLSRINYAFFQSDTDGYIFGT